MPTNADRLLLLADHIKLSLLERSRAISLKLEPNTADAYITRSLETLRQGIEQIEQEQMRLEQDGELSSKSLQDREDTLIKLRSHYDTLASQFAPQSDSTPSSSSTIDLPKVTSKTGLDPNSLPYTDDPDDHHHKAARGLAAYTDDDTPTPRESLMGSNADLTASTRKSKQVRFSDSLVDTSDMSNTQVMTLHQQIMEEQDDTLDRLSESISRQRELSIQIGDELDSQVELLDDLDDGVDRAQRRITGARKRLDTFARKAKDNGSMVTIAVLIIILVLLIALLK